MEGGIDEGKRVKGRERYRISKMKKTDILS